MKTFAVTITKFDGTQINLTAISKHSFDAWDAAVAMFGLCSKIKVTRQ